MTIAGWIILSMILIIVLFVQVIKIQHKLDNIVTVSSKEQVQQENAQKPESAGESVYTDVTEATETPKPMSLRHRRLPVFQKKRI